MTGSIRLDPCVLPRVILSTNALLVSFSLLYSALRDTPIALCHKKAEVVCH